MFTGKEGRFLATQEARALRRAYRDRKPNLSDDECVRSEFFGRENLEKILAVPGCVGVRVYHAKRPEVINGTEHLVPRVVLVGVDENGDDIRTFADMPVAGLKDMPSDNDTQSAELGDGPICPPNCSKGKP